MLYYDYAMTAHTSKDRVVLECMGGMEGKYPRVRGHNMDET